jgi:hypothetical protein
VLVLGYCGGANLCMYTRHLQRWLVQVPSQIDRRMGDAKATMLVTAAPKDGDTRWLLVESITLLWLAHGIWPVKSVALQARLHIIPAGKREVL